MTKTLDNSQDVVDSRDVIARIEELEGERDAFEGFTVPETQDPDDVSDELRAAEWAKANEEDAAELASLVKLQSEAEGYRAIFKPNGCWDLVDARDRVLIADESYSIVHGVLDRLLNRDLQGVGELDELARSIASLS